MIELDGKDNRSLIWKIRDYVIGGGIFAGLVFGLSYTMLINEKNRRFVERCQQKIFRNYDKNSNGVLEGNEIARLAKDCGYMNTIPVANPLARFEPTFEGGANLIVSSYGNDTEGLFWDDEPQWQEKIRVSNEELKELSKE